MKAGDLAAAYPTVRTDTSAADAARLLTEEHRPGLVVVDDEDHPVAVLPGSQVLRFLIPGYVQDDPTLARVLEEEFADNLWDTLAGKTVAELLPQERTPLPVVQLDDTLLEIAAVMAANRCPLVAVVDGPGKAASLVGVISVAQLLEALLIGRVSKP